jgi:YHS domain-containing protein
MRWSRPPRSPGSSRARAESRAPEGSFVGALEVYPCGTVEDAPCDAQDSDEAVLGYHAQQMTMSARAHALIAVFMLHAGCDQGAATTPPTDALEPSPASEAQVVPNLEAQPGDTTTCPYSGRTFVVKAEHPKVDYEGNSYWLCSEDAAQKVRADPSKYFDGFEG